MKNWEEWFPRYMEKQKLKKNGKKKRVLVRV